MRWLAIVLLGACAATPRADPGAAPAPVPEAPLAREVESYLATRPPRTVLSAAADAGDLARKTQNPVSDLISLPFQNNFNTGVGLDDELQYVLNIQPVVPLRLNDDWNLVTRTILPVVYQPEVIPGAGDDFGLGDTTITGFLSPAKPGRTVWGAGPVLLLPTSTGRQLGAGEWGLGASAVGLVMEGPWVYGALVNNVWGFDGNYEAMLLQPFVNYNLEGGWYLASAPILTANWKANDSNTWTIPVGGGAGKITKIGKQPINIQAQVFFNVERPTGGPEWTFRFQIQLLFPK
jgi:hypothetical protein